MPLHEWSGRSGWEGVHLLWIAELLHWVKPRLPAEYRAFVGYAPTLAVGAPAEKPDVEVHSRLSEELFPGEDGDSASPTDAAAQEPDEEIAVSVLQPDPALMVERGGHLIAAVELVSPRNKDRRLARATYATRYVGYLLRGVNLLLVDVHRRPRRFSFANRIAAELQMDQPPLPAPFAVSYRVGEPAATGGRLLAVWRRPLAVGSTCRPCPCRSRSTKRLRWTWKRRTGRRRPGRIWPEPGCRIPSQTCLMTHIYFRTPLIICNNFANNSCFRENA